MKVGRLGLFAMMTLACGVVAAETKAPSEMEVRAAEAECRAAEAKLSDLRADNRLMRTRIETLNTTADLMTGRRSAPPKMQIVENEVLRFAEKGETLDNRATGKHCIYDKWLSLKGGKKYRVKVLLAVDEISDTKNFKLGMMVSIPGKDSQWPAAFIGGSPFAEKEVSFDYYCPEGAGNLFVLGFETGKGVARFRDVRFYELKEVMK